MAVSMNWDVLLVGARKKSPTLWGLDQGLPYMEVPSDYEALRKVLSSSRDREALKAKHTTIFGRGSCICKETQWLEFNGSQGS